MRHLTILIPLALAACGGTSSSPLSDTAEELALSDATVESVSPSTQELVSAPMELPEAVAPGDTDVLASAEPEALVDPVEVAPTARFTLRRGETLAHFARWSELPIEDIALASDLDMDGIYPVGTEIAVPVTGERLAMLVDRRDDHRTARVDAYLESRGGTAGTDFHMVRTGESAWSIAKDSQGIPVWLLESYNPTVDLDRLRPGQQLLVPVIANIVVDVGEDSVSEEELGIDTVIVSEDDASEE